MSRPSQNGSISYFKSVKSTTPKPPRHEGDNLSILKFLGAVQDGLWKVQIEKIRQEQDPAKRKAIKETLPAVTISGLFSKRSKEHLIQHSGFICMDFDAGGITDIAIAFQQLKNDPYTFSVFHSASGKGLACIVKISKPSEHLGNFKRLDEYYQKAYQLHCDPQCSDVTRLRFASYDKGLYLNLESKAWTSYHTRSMDKETERHNINVIVAPSDVQRIVEQVEARQIDMTTNYNDWVAIGFAIADGFGEEGREIFHRISAVNAGYDRQQADRKFTNFLSTDSPNPVKIGTFYYFCQINGIEVTSDRTRKAITLASIKKNHDKTTFKDARQYVARQLDMPMEEAEDIVKKVWESKHVESGLNMPSKVSLFVEHNYSRRLDMVAQKLYLNGKELTKSLRNHVIMEIRGMYGDRASFTDINCALDNHERIEVFHPIKEFFEKHAAGQEGIMDKLASCIPCSTTIGTLMPAEYCRRFVRKWMIGVIAGLHGDPNQLILCLTGAQNTGKTHFFNHLLPAQLREYFDTSTLDHMDKLDVNLRLTKKMIILDDEGGSKNYHESKRLKMITSLKEITYRPLYANEQLTVTRMASFCMTSNETDILVDDTGNRRFIPIDIGESYIDQDAYNAIDKTALWCDAWNAYHAGESYKLTKEEVELFAESFSEFRAVDDLEEAILDLFEHDENCKYPISFAQLKNELSAWHPFTRNIAKHVLGKKLKQMGFKRIRSMQKDDQRKNLRITLYYVKRLKSHSQTTPHQDNPYS